MALFSYLTDEGPDSTRRIGARRPGPLAPKGETIGDLWYDTSTLTLNVWNGSVWVPIGGGSGGSVSPPARIGPSPVGAYGPTYVSIDHTGRAYNSQGNYILLADTTNTFINAPTTGIVFTRINNSTRMQVAEGGTIVYGAAGAEVLVIDTNTVRSNYGFSMPQNTNMYFRGFGDTNHRIFVPSVAPQYGTNFNVDGPVHVGFNNWILATGTNAHWQLNVGANYVNIFGGLGINNGSHNDIVIDPESITMAGGTTGFSMRQRTRAFNDANYRVVLYPSGDNLVFWLQNLSNIASMGLNLTTMNSLSTICMAPPALGGGNTVNLQANSSWQVGYVSSSGKHKINVRALDTTGERNPIFSMKTVRFNWNEEKIANGVDLNTRHPNGVVGLIAEEVAEIAPDAVIHAGPQHQACKKGCKSKHANGEVKEGDPIGLDNDRLIAYLIDAVQHLKKEIVDLKSGADNGKPNRK